MIRESQFVQFHYSDIDVPRLEGVANYCAVAHWVNGKLALYRDTMLYITFCANTINVPDTSSISIIEDCKCQEHSFDSYASLTPSLCSTQVIRFIWLYVYNIIYMKEWWTNIYKRKKRKPECFFNRCGFFVRGSSCFDLGFIGLFISTKKKKKNTSLTQHENQYNHMIHTAQRY